MHSTVKNQRSYEILKKKQSWIAVVEMVEWKSLLKLSHISNCIVTLSSATSLCGFFGARVGFCTDLLWHDLCHRSTRSDPFLSHPIRSSTPHPPREQVVANPNWTSRQKIYEEGISIFYTVISGNAKLLLRVAEIYLVRYMKVISE